MNKSMKTILSMSFVFSFMVGTGWSAPKKPHPLTQKCPDIFEVQQIHNLIDILHHKKHGIFEEHHHLWDVTSAAPIDWKARKDPGEFVVEKMVDSIKGSPVQVCHYRVKTDNEVLGEFFLRPLHLRIPLPHAPHLF